MPHYNNNQIRDLEVGFRRKKSYHPSSPAILGTVFVSGPFTCSSKRGHILETILEARAAPSTNGRTRDV